MSVSTIADLDLLIQKATSETVPNGELDLPVALEISDVIRSRKIPPKECMRCIKKRIGNTVNNPNTQLSSWKLMDVCMKNGGTPFIKEICSREFMDTIEHTILKYHNSKLEDEEIYELITKIFYELYIAFQNDSELNYVSTVYSKLVSRGVSFHEQEHLVDKTAAISMFDSKTPADWIDSDACMICSKKFSILNRRHHCRSCGGIFCQDHSSHTIPLPDLGITEYVRVCDNCFEDYDLKKKKGDHKKKGKKSHHKKKQYDEDDEEEQFKRALELSLRESQTSQSTEPVVPVVETPKLTKEEENDPELKAAIEASLREAEEAHRRNQAVGNNQQQQLQQLQQPNFDLSNAEEEDIYLFASLVERMKTQSVSEILEDTQLQRLYQKVIATKPKINTALNDKVQKYNTLIEMNGKISDIMNIYDMLLEQQLRNINLSQQYSLPQQPSDPYAVYQRTAAPQPVAQPVAQPQLQKPQTVAFEPSINKLQDLHIEQSAEATQLPSEPPYPESEEEVNIREEAVEHNATAGQSGNLPYPVEVEESKEPKKITHYDFPAVPAGKLPASEKESRINKTPVEEVQEVQEEEELLLEL